jgi:tetratricopeptide (TPR) repeat protein
MELDSPHFRLETDTDRRTAEQALTALEQSHALLAHVMQRPKDAPSAHEVQIEVVLFARRKDGVQVLPANAAAAFRERLPADVEDQPVVVMVDSELAADTRNTIQHELAHRFLHERLQTLPVWLDEGLAQYYSSARADGDRIVLGGASTIDFWDQRRFGVAFVDGLDQAEVPLYMAPTVQRLLTATREEFYARGDGRVSITRDLDRSTADYAGSFRLVHLLLNGPNRSDRDAFIAYLGALQRGQDARVAFTAAFGGDLSRLEDAYKDDLRQPGLRLASVPRPPDAPAPVQRERTLSPAEVHVLWARLLPWTRNSSTYETTPPIHDGNAALDRVRRELDAARASGPPGVDLRLVSARLAALEGDFDAARRELDAALASAPDDPRALLATVEWHRASAAGHGSDPHAEGIPPELIGRLARVATTATELNEIAAYHAAREHPDEGMPFALRALRANPICWQCQDTYAVLLFQKGRAEDALAAIERAVSLLPEAVFAPSVLEHLRFLRNAHAARAGRAPKPAL